MTRKVFGYAEDGDARIYNLDDGEDLPDGWRQEPYPGFERHERDTRPDPVKPVEPVAAPDLNDIAASEDKAALDAYAAERGVKLDRRKSFANMMDEFAKASGNGD